MIIDKDKLDWIQLDITARCQAMCLECARNIDGETINPDIGKSNTWDMPIEIFKKAVTPSMLKNSLSKVIFNGNFGDPAIHPDFINICKYVVEHAHDELKFRISSNGAMFDNEYWEKVGKVLAPLKRHSIIFALDGLEDTHHIYRRNTKWQDVIDHAKAFIANGGRAEWQFIIFDHNKHQTNRARELSKKYGFFNIFFKGGSSDDDAGGARNFVKAVEGVSRAKGNETKKNKKVEVDVTQREGYQSAKKIVEEVKYRKPTNYLDTAKISCQWYDTRGMYIEYDGTVWMCCWTGDMHKTYSPKPRKEWEHIEKKFGKYFHSLHHHSFDDILKHEYFVEYLDKTFKSTMSDPETPRSHICARTCIWGKLFV